MRKVALNGGDGKEGGEHIALGFFKVVVLVSLPNGRDKDCLRVSHGRSHALVVFGTGGGNTSQIKSWRDIPSVCFRRGGSTPWSRSASRRVSFTIDSARAWCVLKPNLASTRSAGTNVTGSEGLVLPRPQGKGPAYPPNFISEHRFSSARHSAKPQAEISAFNRGSFQ